MSLVGIMTKDFALWAAEMGRGRAAYIAEMWRQRYCYLTPASCDMFPALDLCGGNGKSGAKMRQQATQCI